MQRTAFFLLTFLFISMVTAVAQQRLDVSDGPLIVGRSNDYTDYLTFVAKLEDHYYFTKTGEPDINIWYGIATEADDQLFTSYTMFEARFIPDSAGRYKIMQYSTLHSFKSRETVEDEWEDGHASTINQYRFIGYSDNPSLAASQALNYYLTHYIDSVIYDSTQVDEQPALKSGGTVVNIEEIIKNNLLKYGTLKQEEKESVLFLYQRIDSIDRLSGFVRFSYVVRENEKISHITVEEINLNNPEKISDICVGISHQILYCDMEKYRWAPGKINGKPVAVRQYVTIHFKPKNVFVRNWENLKKKFRI
jgi:hypothetical protein